MIMPTLPHQPHDPATYDMVRPPRPAVEVNPKVVLYSANGEMLIRKIGFK